MTILIVLLGKLSAAAANDTTKIELAARKILKQRRIM
jgi:hypothetical protein